ncbi:hypothetical protein BKA66DRAFT_455045 [Pyrenochaeta sp. MPI-SDFR-AT-0127]|nr:hypothetical protein BKA66DRAFT_455045 [Pyrenochaeta sp. MPI-SDFR-AT-0127]
MAQFLVRSKGLPPSLAFVPCGDAPVKLIEVTSDGTQSRLEVTQELVESYIERDFKTHVVKPTKTDHETIKLFWSRRLGDYNGDMIPIPLSPEMFARISPFARIPETYRRIVEYKTATNVFATPQIPRGFSNSSPEQVRKEYLSFIIQSVPGAANNVCVGTSFTYHFPTRHMYLFMHGLANVSFDDLSYSIQWGAASATAFLIPSIVIQRNLEQRLKALNLWQDKIYWHERRLGIRFDHHDNPDLATIDFTNLSKDLNAANTNLAYILWSCKSTTRQLEFLNMVVKRYRAQAIANGTTPEEVSNVEIILLDAHAHLRSWNNGLEDRAEYLSKRGQALVQTVYSGIAQRDSATSLHLAAISTELAKTSQSVAVATSRDSAVMRIIAAITIFFLPATFTATFFSTSFFQFNADLNGRVYSWWLWLYFSVTVILTLLVLLGTWFLWKKKEMEVEQQFNKHDKHEKLP